MYITPERLEEACARVVAIARSEIHAKPRRKNIVTIEDDDTNAAADSYVALHGVPGLHRLPWFTNTAVTN